MASGCKRPLIGELPTEMEGALAAPSRSEKSASLPGRLKSTKPSGSRETGLSAPASVRSITATAFASCSVT
jgi:hypothetical protein